VRQFDPIQNNSDKTEQHGIASDRRELTLPTRLQPKPGQRLYELDMNAYPYMINEVKILERDVAIIPDKNIITGQNYGVKTKSVRKYTRRNGCLYVVAINPENADHQFKKLIENHRKRS
jgi:hypothetical protein